MTRKLLLLLMVQIFQICKSNQFPKAEHNIQKRTVMILNKHRAPQHYSQPYGALMNNRLMYTLRQVLVDTLKSLNKVNYKLADYFVQHHPSLTNIYNRMIEVPSTTPRTVIIDRQYTPIDTTQSTLPSANIMFDRGQNFATNTTTTEPNTSVLNEIIVSGNNSNSKSTLEDALPGPPILARPVTLTLSEFNVNPLSNNAEKSLRAKNITAAALTATKVKSNVVHANDIIADNVMVTRTRNKMNSRINGLASFSFRNNEASKRKISGVAVQPVHIDRTSNRDRQLNRKNYFPPRQDSFSHRVSNTNPFLIQNQYNARSSPIFPDRTIKYINTRKSVSMFPSIKSHMPAIPVIKATLAGEKRTTDSDDGSDLIWGQGSWSDSDEYYDEDFEANGDNINKPSIIKGNGIDAGSINANKMFAVKVKAKKIDVRQVIANDVVVSARYDD